MTLPAGTIFKGQRLPEPTQPLRHTPRARHAANPVYFTSLKDDTVGGDTNNDGTATAPAKGDWGQLYVTSGGRLEMTYAERALRRQRNLQLRQQHPTLSTTPPPSSTTPPSATAPTTASDLYADTTGTTGQLTFTNGTVRNNDQNGIQAYRNSGTA